MPRKYPLALALLALSLAATRGVAVESGPGTAKDVGASAEQEGKLVVYSTTDASLVAPLLKDFAALYPKLTLEYNDMNSTELYNRLISEAAAGSGSADFLWSSAMDLQMKLANDAYALAYASP